MSDDGRTSTSTNSSITGGPTPNFSRPRQHHHQPPRAPSALKSTNTKPPRDRHVHILDAFHEPPRAPPAASSFPDEPRFSGESERTDHTSSEHSWDGHAGEVDSARRRRRMDAQRAAAVASGRPGLRSGTSAGSGTVKRTDSAASSSVDGSHAPAPPKIVKRVSVDQQSERVAAFEDSGSHHTVSESGEEVGAVELEGSAGRWQCSDGDVSQLSEAEIRRLEKKGINPALWVEMQQAKKGKKKWMPHLLGNGFIN